MVPATCSAKTILDILSTDFVLLKRLKQLFLHQQSYIAGRDAESLQKSSEQLDEIAVATEQNNQRKAQYLQDPGIVCSDGISGKGSWEVIAGSVIGRLSDTGNLSTANAVMANGVIAEVKVLAEECRKLCRDNQKTMVMQMTLTGKMLNRLRGPAIDNGSAYCAGGYTRQASESLSLAMA